MAGTRFGVTFRRRGTAKRRFGATTAGGAWGVTGAGSLSLCDKLRLKESGYDKSRYFSGWTGNASG